MKVKIKTKYWKEENTDKWRDRLSNMVYLFAMNSVVNLAWLIFTETISIILITTNTLFLAVALLIIITKNKYKEEQRKNEPETNKRDKENIQEPKPEGRTNP